MNASVLIISNAVSVIGLILFFSSFRVGLFPVSSMSKSEKVAEILFHLGAWCVGIGSGIGVAWAFS